MFPACRTIFFGCKDQVSRVFRLVLVKVALYATGHQPVQGSYEDMRTGTFLSAHRLAGVNLSPIRDLSSKCLRYGGALLAVNVPSGDADRATHINTYGAATE